MTDQTRPSRSPLTGRYAPSPTGRLHLGNLRTALVSWLFARSSGGAFHLRFEDLDRVAIRPEHYETQAADLEALGLTWDGSPIRQSDRTELYRDVISQLQSADLVYPCYCSRREIREATQAPNGPWSHGHYPGTCRHLTTADHRVKEANGRPTALRVRSHDLSLGFHDLLCGDQGGVVDDFVIQRGDGVPAYNLVVVVDDHAQEIDLVVRGDDLISSTPRQLFVSRLLGHEPPMFAHVPLVLNERGDRLAKRDGAVTLADRLALGQTPAQVLGVLAASLGLSEIGEPVSAEDLVERFEPSALPRAPWRISDEALETSSIGLAD